ncbi:hypothetical protein Tco_0426311 [Tanacetum coccineum]
MPVLMVQHGCDAAIETLPADIEAREKSALMKKAYSTLILCLGDRVLLEVTKETTAAGIWTKLTSLYMTKSLSNRLYLKKKLYTYYMSPECKGDLAMEDVLMTLNSRELNKRTEGTKDVTGDGLYVRGRSVQGNVYFGEALVVVRNDEMTELVMDSDESYHMTHIRDFLYDFKVVDGGSVQLGDNRTCIIKGTEKVKIELHDGSSCVLKDVRYVLGLRRSLISLGILKKGLYYEDADGYIKVIKGCRVMMTGIRKKNCVYTLSPVKLTLRMNTSCLFEGGTARELKGFMLAEVFRLIYRMMLYNGLKDD